MAIQKKSLISTLKTTKKANVAKEEFATATNDSASTGKIKTQRFAKKTDMAHRMAKSGRGL